MTVGVRVRSGVREQAVSPSIPPPRGPEAAGAEGVSEFVVT